MKSYILPLALVIGASSSTPGFGALQVATIARVEGDVRLFKKPAAKASKEGGKDQVLMDGVYYSAQVAKIGDQLELGNVVATIGKGKARLIYKNGDSVTVSENSMLKVRWKADSETQPVFEVLGGAIRGQFLKGGPRTNSEVKSRSAVMGVRGTDFYLATNGQGSKISIIRGQVDLRPATPNAKPVIVASGFSADIAAPAPKPKAEGSSATTAPVAPSEIIVQRTPAAQILVIQKQSLVKKPENVPPQAAELKELEEKSVDVALEDIKQEDPKLYAQMKSGAVKIEDADKVTTMAAKEVYKSAIKAEAKDKPGELQGVEDAYDKYFRD